METKAQEIARLMREIGERQARLQYLALGDQAVGVSIEARLGPDHLTCRHQHYNSEKHGRRCTCGTRMVDFGD